ncbi:MAG: BadF/BadG/BcrA/BcrD ATPase family protein [Lachnospiraceae bacterium]|jgi:N-acetylglucosamine kinase-like BadF-type ATPase
MRYYTGLDVGGTSGRVLFEGTDGKKIGSFEGIGCAFNTDGPVIGKEKYSRLMREALGTFSLRAKDCAGVCAAASGVDSPKQADSLRDIFASIGFAPDRVIVLNDCEVFLYLTDEPSMVVISGTGSVCYGRNRAGQVFRTGGWNHILSDEGSAFWIGLQAVRAAAETMDGRRKADSLREKICGICGFSTLEEADVWTTEHLNDKRTVGKLSAAVGKLAEEGDSESAAILRDAADQVFRLVQDTFRKMYPQGRDEEEKPVRLWLWGSVCVKNPVFQNRLRERAAADLPVLNPAVPEQPALETALRTAVNSFPC